MAGVTVVFGYGAVGRAVVHMLAARGGQVRLAQRSAPNDLPAGVTFVRCDILKADDVRRAADGAGQAVLAVGFPYDSRIWRKVWPVTMTNAVEACAAAHARLVFIDNLYQLGPQTEPRREDMALSRKGRKPAILTKVTQIWMAVTGRVRIAALRCTDFYGPDVPVSHIGATGFGEIAKGKRAQLIAPPDTPHDFAYVPDIARATLTLLDAPDDAYGQIWNMPCAPTRTPREILQIGADAIGKPLRILAIPLWLLPLFGLFQRFMKEVVDVRFTFDRPYIVDGSKFTERFGFVVTPFETGAPETARYFLAQSSA